MSPKAQESLAEHALAILRMVHSEAHVAVFDSDELQVIARALTSMDARTDKTDKLLDSIREKLGIENPYTGRPDDRPDGEE